MSAGLMKLLSLVFALVVLSLGCSRPIDPSDDPLDPTTPTDPDDPTPADPDPTDPDPVDPVDPDPTDPIYPTDPIDPTDPTDPTQTDPPPPLCGDECVLGDVGCSLRDVDGDPQTLDPGDRLADRARAFEKWLRNDTDSLFHGGIVSARYETTARHDVDSVYIGDTALHTGVYLAAEAARLTATNSPRARTNVRQLSETIDRWLRIPGQPGVLATFSAPAGDARLRQWTDWDCNDFDRHCDVAWNGQRWDYVGDPSRDMYVGPLMGLFLAHRALGSSEPATTALLREDLMVLAEEVTRLRTMPVRFTINGLELPPRDMEMRFFIPDDTEMIDGAVDVTIDTGDVENSGAITGGQEFFPNPSVLFRQIDMLGNLRDIPRRSSAMMVGAFVTAALDATENDPAFATRRAALMDFWNNNDDEWGNGDSMVGYAAGYEGDQDCDSAYFGANIAFIPAYVWSLAEPNEARHERVVDEVIGSLHEGLGPDKNAFFDAMTVGAHQSLGRPVDPTIASATLAQIEDFPSPPRVRRDVDGGQGGCADDALDVSDRPVVYFQWHSNPWNTRDDGDARQTYPGHDYLVAYWFARMHGLLEDERPEVCLQN
ncbi:MAG: hypothetical protein Q8O67_31305 [Deltaproteobacteria bacterium]|nr:hypothetical protein [Deltaproteobacteria bacterium]